MERCGPNPNCLKPLEDDYSERGNVIKSARDCKCSARSYTLLMHELQIDAPSVSSHPLKYYTSKFSDSPDDDTRLLLLTQPSLSHTTAAAWSVWIAALIRSSSMFLERFLTYLVGDSHAPSGSGGTHVGPRDFMGPGRDSGEQSAIYWSTANTFSIDVITGRYYHYQSRSTVSLINPYTPAPRTMKIFIRQLYNNIYIYIYRQLYVGIL